MANHHALPRATTEQLAHDCLLGIGFGSRDLFLDVLNLELIRGGQVNTRQNPDWIFEARAQNIFRLINSELQIWQSWAMKNLELRTCWLASNYINHNIVVTYCFDLRTTTPRVNHCIRFFTLRVARAWLRGTRLKCCVYSMTNKLTHWFPFAL